MRLNLYLRHARLPRVVQVLAELRIVGEDGSPLPQDGSVAGDLKVRGPWVTAGYFKGEGGTVVDAEGWFATGDVAKITSDGYVQITDRSKDVIKSGGEWISSIDLENAAMAHPDVQEAAVIGLPSEKWGESPLAIVVPKDDALTAAEVLDYCRGKLAGFKQPKAVEFVDEIPRNPSGKILKRVLREQFPGPAGV